MDAQQTQDQHRSDRIDWSADQWCSHLLGEVGQLVHREMTRADEIESSSRVGEFDKHWLRLRREHLALTMAMSNLAGAASWAVSGGHERSPATTGEKQGVLMAMSRASGVVRATIDRLVLSGEALPDLGERN